MLDFVDGTGSMRQRKLSLKSCGMSLPEKVEYLVIGVEEQAARILMGETSELLASFEFNRFSEHKSWPKFNAPFPWM